MVTMAYHWRGIKHQMVIQIRSIINLLLGIGAGTHEDGLKGFGIVGGNRQVIVNNEDGDNHSLGYGIIIILHLLLQNLEEYHL